MNEKNLEKFKKKLEKEKDLIEKELETFTKRDRKLRGDWDAFFPSFDGETGGASLEKAADEVEEYEARLSIEYALEVRLENIDLALEKIKKGKYGICEKCKKPISLQRLRISPEARTCLKCQRR